jgi:hypothetical protein
MPSIIMFSSIVLFSSVYLALANITPVQSTLDVFLARSFDNQRYETHSSLYTLLFVVDLVCTPDMCNHHGTCLMNQSNSFTCQCDPGFAGATCTEGRPTIVDIDSANTTNYHSRIRRMSIASMCKQWHMY